MSELSPAFRAYAHLLRKLHELIAKGEDEGEAGESVREAMDEPGERLTPEEIELAKLLSADLYTLSLLPPSRPPAVEAERVAFEIAVDEKRWPEVLSRLHERPDLADLAGAALLRAQVWLSYGMTDTAAEFIALARRRHTASAPGSRRRSSRLPRPTFDNVEAG